MPELLTKLDSVESYGFKAVRDARKELVVQIERKLVELEVIRVLGEGERKSERQWVESRSRNQLWSVFVWEIIPLWKCQRPRISCVGRRLEGVVLTTSRCSL